MLLLERRYHVGKVQCGGLGGQRIQTAPAVDEGGFLETAHVHIRYGRRLEKRDTRFCASIPSVVRLALTLHFLAQGMTISQEALLYGIGKSTAAEAILMTIEVLHGHMVP